MTEFREGDKTIEIVARAKRDERNLASAVSDINIYTPSGRFVPISQVARVELALEEARTWRRNRLPTITVRADVAPGVQPPDVTEAILPKLEPIKAKLPVGYYIDAGGSWYESRVNEKPMQALFPIMIVMVVALLMLQLQSFPLPEAGTYVFGLIVDGKTLAEYPFTASLLGTSDATVGQVH